MMAAVPYLLTLPPVILVAVVCLPNGWVNRQSRAFRQWVTLVVGWQFRVWQLGGRLPDRLGPTDSLHPG